MNVLEVTTASGEMLNEISLYELLSTVSEKMLQAAENEAWDDMVLLEKQHHEVYTRLRQVDERQSLSQNPLDRKAVLINQILKTDKQTQELIQQRMDKLQKGGAEERKILQAYG